MGTKPEQIPDLVNRFGEEDKYYQRETPQLRPDLPAFHIARFPVTVAQFGAFVEQSGYEPGHKDSLRGVANHPVVGVYLGRRRGLYPLADRTTLQRRTDLPSFLRKS